MIRVTHARYFITVPGLEQQSSRVGGTEFQGWSNTVPRWAQSIEVRGTVPGLDPSSPGSERDDIPSGNPWVWLGSTTIYVGESDNAGSHSCSSTTVSCYTCTSR